MAATQVKRVFRSLGRRIGLATREETSTNGERDADYYNRYFAGDEGYAQPYYRSHYYALWSVIVDRVRRDGFRRVLEMGCGTGQMAAYLLDQGVDEYVGVDFSAQAVEMARAVASRGRFIIDDARTSQIYTSFEYEVLLCTEMLEHIDADLEVIARFPAGKRCLCTVPNFPYESHVRYFDDAGAVMLRYGQFFDKLDILSLTSPKSFTSKFFLFDGIRNQEIP